MSGLVVGRFMTNFGVYTWGEFDRQKKKGMFVFSVKSDFRAGLPWIVFTGALNGPWASAQNPVLVRSFDLSKKDKSSLSPFHRLL